MTWDREKARAWLLQTAQDHEDAGLMNEAERLRNAAMGSDEYVCKPARVRTIITWVLEWDDATITEAIEEIRNASEAVPTSAPVAWDECWGVE